MKENIDRLIEILKEQAQVFLLDAKEFYPFGTCINKENEIVPVSAYWENDNPPSQPLIDLLEKHFKQGIENGDYKIAGIAIDGLQRENNFTYDIIEIRFFETDKEVYKKYFKYEIKEHSVEFFENSL
ncbi:MAG TPA: hypothetical protein VGN20_17120 [Mucilaginibacter sp.]|jgi:hypothetical protein